MWRPAGLRTMNSRLCGLALFVASGLAGAWPVKAPAQDQEALTPYIGETAAAFEARKRGLPRPMQADASTVTLIADARGHFSVEPAINGTRIRMLVDTGASSIALSERDARAVGISLPAREFTIKMATANGTVLVAPTSLPEVSIGGIVLRDVRAVVVPEDKLQTSLLGMSFLSRLSRFEVSEGKL